VLKIRGDPKGAVSALDSVQQATHKFGNIVKTVIAGAAVKAVADFGKSCINAAGEAQQGEVLLRSSLGNIKGMTDANKDAAVEWVNKMESAKSFDDSEISAALQRMAIKTGDLSKAQELTNVAMEVARNKNVDLATATGLVDQAYNGSARALKTFGIEAGPDGEAVKGMEAIEALQQKVKGSGDAWLTTLEGQRTAFKTTFGNLQEAIGGALMPLANELLSSIMPALTKGMELVTKYTPEIQAGVEAFLTTVQKIGSWVIETVGEMWKALKPSIDAVVEQVGPYIKELFAWLKEQGPIIQKILVGVAEAIGTAFRIVAAVIKGIVDSIKWIIDHFKQASSDVDKALGSKGDTLSTGRYTASSGAIQPHAAGGWVGLNGPEIALVGEKGPEYITPAGQVGASDSLLRELIQEVHALRRDTAQQTRGFAAAVQGMAR